MRKGEESRSDRKTPLCPCGDADSRRLWRAVADDMPVQSGAQSLGTKRASGSAIAEPRILLGEKMRLHFQHESAGVLVEHQPIDLIRIGLFFGSSVHVVSWSGRSSKPRERRLVSPHLYIIPPGIAHTTCCETRTESCTMAVNDPLWRHIAKRDVSDVLPVEAAQHDLIIWTAAFLLRHLSERIQQATAPLIDFLGCSLLCRLGDLLPTSSEPSTVRERGLSDDERRRVIEFMQRNLKHNIHVDDLAKQTGHCTAHFTELFTQTMGCSPFRYLKELRMRTARDLLVSGGQSIREAACAVGYLNLDHFSEVFRKFWGSSPREFVGQLRDCIRESPGPFRESPGKFSAESCQRREPRPAFAL